MPKSMLQFSFNSPVFFFFFFNTGLSFKRPALISSKSQCAQRLNKTSKIQFIRHFSIKVQQKHIVFCLLKKMSCHVGTGSQYQAVYYSNTKDWHAFKGGNSQGIV